MGKLYERAEIYDLIESEQRSEITRRDWAAFLEDRPIRTLLDVSIGTGGMTLPLQELGIEVFGSDLSEAMLTRCREKAAGKGRPVECRQADFRDLSCWAGRQFDCVASTGNSLGYVENDGVLQALERMDALVKPGGYLCFDSRNWEKIQREKPRFYLYNPFFHGDDRVNLVQVWDHNDDGSVTFNLLYTFERGNRIFQKEQFEERYHPFPKDLAAGKLLAMGYTDLVVGPVPGFAPVTEFDKMEWYRLIARKPYLTQTE